MKTEEINECANQVMKEFKLPSLGLGISYKGETFSQEHGDADQDIFIP